MKLRFDKTKRKYKNGRKIYNYDRITLVFPSKYHDLLKLFKGKQLLIQVTKRDETINISISERKQP